MTASESVMLTCSDCEKAAPRGVNQTDSSSVWLVHCGSLCCVSLRDRLPLTAYLAGKLDALDLLRRVYCYGLAEASG